MPGGLLQQRIALRTPFGSCNRYCLSRKAVSGVSSAKGFDGIDRQANCGSDLAEAESFGPEAHDKFLLLRSHILLPLRVWSRNCGS